MKRVIRILLIISVLALCICMSRRNTIEITPIKGDLKFTDKYQPKASVCIPAAYTGKDGKIEGQYRINGVTRGSKTLKEYTSIHPETGLVISKEWKSGNGFQQHVLVKDGKVRSFKDKRRFRRRALCCNASDPGSLFIIESTRMMTMNEFAAEVSKHCTHAVNLDMGRWGYGWVGKQKLSRWAIVYRHWQTNWVVCE